MCAVFTFSGSASVLILLASLATLLVSGADDIVIVTIERCKYYGDPYMQVRQYPEDRNATFLRLDSCVLDHLNENDIVGLPHVKTIFLDTNSISHIDLSIFRHVPKLEYLTLSFNKLHELSPFPEHSCPRLDTLELQNNHLTTLNDAGTFSACTKLKILHLTHNQIAYIHMDLFVSLTELKELYLDNNKLAFIPDQMFRQNLKLRKLWLHGNRLTYLPEDFASNFKCAGVGLDEFYYYNNPWHCACLLQLLVDVKRAGVHTYEFGHFYGYQRECVYLGALPCNRLPPSRLLPPPALHGGC